MALIDFKVQPGIDKQNTDSGAEFRWVDSDNVRFRYNLPEKVGGWSSLVTDTIVGVARREFAFVDLDGNRYAIIGTDKFLLIYFEGQLYDNTFENNFDISAMHCNNKWITYLYNYKSITWFITR